MTILPIHAPRVTKPRDPRSEAMSRHPSSQPRTTKAKSGGVGVGYTARGQHDIGPAVLWSNHRALTLREVLHTWHRSHMLHDEGYRLTVQKALHWWMYHWCQIKGVLR